MKDFFFNDFLVCVINSKNEIVFQNDLFKLFFEVFSVQDWLKKIDSKEQQDLISTNISKKSSFSFQKVTFLKNEKILYLDALGSFGLHSNYPDDYTLLLRTSINPSELEQSNENFNRINELNYNRLYNYAKKLKKSRESEKQAILEREAFLAKISHEIKTPLNGIIGLSRLLSEADINPKHKRYTDAIVSSSEQLLKLLNDLLEMARLTGEKFSINEHPFNLSTIIENCVQVFALQAASKNLKFEVNVNNSIPEVLLGDAERLLQILNNALSNAIKYTKNGMVMFKCEVMDQSKETVLVHFEISDTGEGMSKKELEAVFHPFSRFQKKVEGTGLGLMISKDLATAMSGRIHIQSEKDSGTVFMLEVPFKKIKNEVLQSAHHSVISTGIRELAKANVIAADDNEVNRFYLESVFERIGQAIITVDNAPKLLEELKKDDFDLVLMDIEMPGMNGIEAVTKIRNELKMNLPVIAVTANNTKLETKKYLEKGFTDIIQKPFSKEDIIEMLWKYGTSHNNQEERNLRFKETESRAESKELKWKNLRSIVESDETKLHKFLALSHKSISDARSNMMHARENNNIEEIKSNIHKLKSTLGMLGYEHIFKKLESLENKKDLTLVEYTFEENSIESALELISEEINNYLKNGI